MTISAHAQTNFTTGVISPRLRGRSDLAKYVNAVNLLQNFVVQKHGGVVNRSGTRFAAAAKNSGTTIPTIDCCGCDSGIRDETDSSSWFASSCKLWSCPGPANTAPTQITVIAKLKIIIFDFISLSPY